MSDRIETIELINLPNGESIRTKEIIDFPTNDDIANLLTKLGTSHFARIETIWPVVEILDQSDCVVDYARSESTSITIKLKGE